MLRKIGNAVLSWLWVWLAIIGWIVVFAEPSVVAPFRDQQHNVRVSLVVVAVILGWFVVSAAWRNRNGREQEVTRSRAEVERLRTKVAYLRDLNETLTDQTQTLSDPANRLANAKFHADAWGLDENSRLAAENAELSDVNSRLRATLERIVSDDKRIRDKAMRYARRILDGEA